MPVNVVDLRNHPSLLDVPDQLRRLADKIERGEQPVEAVYAVVVEPDAFTPVFYGWGKIADRHAIAGLFLHVAQLALTDASE